MCTLIVLHRCVAAAPLVVAANRDEYLERPSSGPALRETSSGKVLAPRDERAGGTWLGLNGSGVFAAVTNRRCEDPDPDRRSRGLIVMDALRAGTAREAAEEIEGLPADAYNPFNLLVADARTAHVFSCTDRVERIDLEPGAHVVGNVHPADGSSAKMARLRREVAAVTGGAADDAGDVVLDRLAGVCRSHEGAAALEATCVHAGPYGTRSSTLLRLGPSGGELRHADDAPCRREYRDFTSLLCELGLASGRFAGRATARKVS